MPNNRCVICNLLLDSRKQKQRHYASSAACRPRPPRQFRCCDCDTEFLDNGRFTKHIRKGCSNKRQAGLPPSHAGDAVGRARTRKREAALVPTGGADGGGGSSERYAGLPTAQAEDEDSNREDYANEQYVAEEDADSNRRDYPNERYAALPTSQAEDEDSNRKDYSYSSERYTGLPTAQGEHADPRGRGPGWCAECDFGFGTTRDLRSHMELGVHRRYTHGLKPIHGDVAYSGPIEVERAALLDRLDGLRLAGHAYRVRVARYQTGGGDSDIDGYSDRYHGEGSSEGERRD